MIDTDYQSLAPAISWCLHSPGLKDPLPSLLSFYITSYEFSSQRVSSSKVKLFKYPPSPHLWPELVSLESAFLLWVGDLFFWRFRVTVNITVWGSKLWLSAHSSLTASWSWPVLELLQFLSKVHGASMLYMNVPWNFRQAPKCSRFKVLHSLTYGCKSLIVFIFLELNLIQF